MSAPLNRISRLNDGICRLSLWFAAAGLAFMTAIICWQVFGRYVLNASPVWAESVALLLMLYYALLAAAVGVRLRFHLGIRIVVDSLPGRVSRPVQLVGHALVGWFGILMAINGVSLADYTLGHAIPTLGVSRAVAYVPFILAGGLIAVFSLEHLLRLLQGEGTWD